jgi:hypothetical protein
MQHEGAIDGITSVNPRVMAELRFADMPKCIRAAADTRIAFAKALS